MPSKAKSSGASSLQFEAAPKKQKISDDSKHVTPPLEQVALWTTMTSKELKELVKAKGLPVTGTIPQYIARLYTGKKAPKDIEEDVAKNLGGKNPYLATKFAEAAALEDQNKQFHLLHIAKVMEYYPFKITSGAQMAKVKGVGKSTVAKIDKFLAEENMPAEEAAPQVEAQGQSAPVEVSEGQGASPEARVLAVLRADTSENGLTVGLIAEQLPDIDVDELTQVIKHLVDNGFCITTVDEHHFQAV